MSIPERLSEEQCAKALKRKVNLLSKLADLAYVRAALMRVATHLDVVSSGDAVLDNFKFHEERSFRHPLISEDDCARELINSVTILAQVADIATIRGALHKALDHLKEIGAAASAVTGNKGSAALENFLDEPKN